MDKPDINECFITFSNTIFDIFNRNLPYKEKTIKALDVSKPYITREISTLIREKHRLQRLYRKYPIKYGDEYRDCRNEVTKFIQEARAAYFYSKLESDFSNSQSMRSTVNDILR